MGKTLIAYFSHSGTTRRIAEDINKINGGDLFEIKTTRSYPSNYNAVVDEAKKELRANARPELATHIKDMSSYDTVIIGYPNWWNTIPMPLFTFFEEYDFSGKTIAPFCTHGGGGIGQSEEDIQKLCPNSSVVKGIAIGGHASGDALDSWLKKEVIK